MKRKNFVKWISILLTVCCMIAFCSCAKGAAEAVRVGSLKGPTSMGLLFLMAEEKEEADRKYEFTMATQADELLAKLVKEELDIALVPANVAATAYQKTNGAVAVLNINTLGVLYLVSGDHSIEKPEDLKGRTVYLTGKGTTPDHVFHYIMEANGIAQTEYALEYKSEATEVAAVLAADPGAVGVLPQPFVTAACAQNEALAIVMDVNAEWEQLQGEAGSRMVTGVTVVRREFLEAHPEAVSAFLEVHRKSAEAINQDPGAGAGYAVAEGIVAKEGIAQKAISFCNITCISGEEMRRSLSGYLEVLFEQNPQSVGGKLPDDAFYIP